jgi:DNA-binding CsgD family transcriptional regulator
VRSLGIPALQGGEVQVIETLRESEPMRLVESAGEPVLSKREQDVVRCVAEGLSNLEIARCLGLTEHTVKNYLFRIFDKLGVSALRLCSMFFVFAKTKTGWLLLRAAPPRSAHPGQNC